MNGIARGISVSSLSRFLRLVLTAAVVEFAGVIVLVGAAPSQTVSTLYSFPKQGGEPRDLALVQGRDGQLYGTTVAGGTNSVGTVFKVSTGGVARLIHSFDTNSGGTPEGGLTLGTDGFFYGTTVYGGSAVPPYGVLFKLSPNGSTQVLVNFTDTTGNAISPPVEVGNGHFYGTTDGSSATSVGNLYELTQSGVFTVLDTFGGSLGSYPHGKLALGTDNRLYGIADLGGANKCGTLFEVTLSGLPVSIYNFDCVTANNPVGGPILANDGNFYGTTDEGGTHGMGIVYKFDQRGVLTVLYNFGDTAFDSFTQGALLQATDGNLYGTTESGGMYGNGTIFQVTLAGVYTRLYDFPGNGGPQYVGAGLTQHTSGALYGESQGGGSGGTGAIFRLDMGLAPFISFVVPVGKVGQTAQILGQGLTGTASVTFNGIPATNFSVKSDTYMTAVVPSGATTGPVVVTTPSSMLKSNKDFRVSK